MSERRRRSVNRQDQIVPNSNQYYGEYQNSDPAYQPQRHEPINVIINNTANASSVANSGFSGIGESHFDGGLAQLIGWYILGYLVTVFTLGICFPWAVCMIYKWKINHTVIDGRRLQFRGSAASLFGQWIKWLLLSLITAGIYALWVGIKLEQWRVKHTHFMG